MSDTMQYPPNKPRFGLVLVVSCVTLIAGLVLAYFVLDWDAGGLLPKRTHVRRTTLTQPYAASEDLNAA